ncbi:MAG: Holliday junction resolvase RuvX [Ruminococcaceae bacterium]|nr:Holliday junction resolvase RuvX [Oscillospiraceae bacterium]
MIIMSVDYGDTRTGVAICDKREILASPVTVITEKYRPNLIKKLIEIINERKPELIVVGLPKNMDGSCGERCEKCTEFANELREVTGIKVDMWDERLTTVSAYRALNEADFHGRKTRQVIDAVAAVTILQDYLARRKSQNG